VEIQKTRLPGVLIVTHNRFSDFRGDFEPVFSREVAEALGMELEILQVNSSRSTKAGTIRGLHWQASPFEQIKLVRCTRGEIFDVVVDVRPLSATYGKHLEIHLSEGDRLSLYVPRGFAHGWQAVEDKSEITYLVGGNKWKPGWERGLRYNDPSVDIKWPVTPQCIIDRDQDWPDLHVRERIS
jgi:dTDP-4-dehydrorhamnose 3,5-epimerase